MVITLRTFKSSSTVGQTTTQQARHILAHVHQGLAGLHLCQVVTAVQAPDKRYGHGRNHMSGMILYRRGYIGHAFDDHRQALTVAM